MTLVAVAWASSGPDYSVASGSLGSGGVASGGVEQAGMLGVVDEVLGLTISRDDAAVFVVEPTVPPPAQMVADSSDAAEEAPTASAVPSIADSWRVSPTSVVAGGLGPAAMVTGPTTAPPSTATSVPPTAVPPTAVPPTAVPPTVVPPTAVPPTAVPTMTAVPVPTATSVPPVPTAPTAPPDAQRVAEISLAAAAQAIAPIAPAQSQAGATQPDHVRRGEAALARIPYSLSSIGFTISFQPGRGGLKGLTYHDRNHIEVFVSSSMSDGELVNVIAHEIGHAVDLMLTSYEDRDAWYAARNIHPSTPWWPVGIVSDFSTPAGDFAECFAYWAVGSPSRSAFGSCAGTTQLMSQMVRG